MKIYLKTLLLALTLSLGFSLQAQSTREGKEQLKQEKLRNQYGETLKEVALKVGKYVMKQAAPMSGKELRADALLYEGIEENKAENCIVCTISISFQARDWPSVGYADAIVLGTVYYYPSYRSIDRNKVYFVATGYNRHMELVTSEGIKQSLKKGVLLEL